jgi:hypothetical protein
VINTVALFFDLRQFSFSTSRCAVVVEIRMGRSRLDAFLCTVSSLTDVEKVWGTGGNGADGLLKEFKECAAC